MKMVFATGLIGASLTVASPLTAQGQDPVNLLWKQCNEQALAVRLDPEPIQEVVGTDFPLALEEGKARVALIVQDCSQYWLDGKDLGPTQHAHVWVAIKGQQEVRTVVGAQRTLPTMTWFSLSAGSANPRGRELRERSRTSPDPIEKVSLNLNGQERGGSVSVGDGLSYSWNALSGQKPGRLLGMNASTGLVGVNHDVYVRGSDGRIVLKRIQALCNLVAGPSEGSLFVIGGTDPSKLIGTGTYQIQVLTFMPVWARVELGAELPRD